ncbi:hypothetical protein PR048_022946 [Dryococelus australis]|uniref:Uncharacterized protein n=1 Tax=Dryococelus australis TaxID=614101 RepID=A0ABQ9GSP3_9NEOP|nr:hypothetical protein PR048_022946 [Dryococelus australis]
MQEGGRGKRGIPEKTRLPAASSGTIPTYENPGVTRPGIELGSPWWQASKLTAKPPRPRGTIQPVQSRSPLYRCLRTYVDLNIRLSTPTEALRGLNRPAVPIQKVPRTPSDAERAITPDIQSTQRRELSIPGRLTWQAWRHSFVNHYALLGLPVKPLIHYPSHARAERGKGCDANHQYLTHAAMVSGDLNGRNIQRYSTGVAARLVVRRSPEYKFTWRRQKHPRDRRRARKLQSSVGAMTTPDCDALYAPSVHAIMRLSSSSRGRRISCGVCVGGWRHAASSLPTTFHSSAYWSLSCVFIGCCPAPGSYGVRELFPCNSAIGSEACRAGIINCDPIAEIRDEIPSYLNIACVMDGVSRLANTVVSCTFQHWARTRTPEAVVLPREHFSHRARRKKRWECFDPRLRNHPSLPAALFTTWYSQFAVFPSLGHFSRCPSSIARNSATHSLINSNSTHGPEACRNICSVPLTISNVQRTPNHTEITGHGGLVVRLLASHQGELLSIPNGVAPDLRMWESCRTMPLVGGSSRGYHVSPALSFRSTPYSPQPPSSALKTSIVSLDRRKNKVIRPVAMINLHMAEGYNAIPEVDRKQLFQKCLIYLEQPEMKQSHVSMKQSHVSRTPASRTASLTCNVLRRHSAISYWQPSILWTLHHASLEYHTQPNWLPQKDCGPGPLQYL